MEKQQDLERQFEEKVKEINDYEQQHGEDDHSCIMRGVLLYQIGEYRKAIQCFHTALAHNPENADAYYNMSAALLETGDWAQAAVMDAKARRQMPADQADAAELDAMYGDTAQGQARIYRTVRDASVHTFVFLPSVALTEKGAMQRSQQMACALARLGQKVIYVNPPIRRESQSKNAAGQGNPELSHVEFCYVNGVQVFSPYLDLNNCVNNFDPLIEHILSHHADPTLIVSVPEYVTALNNLKRKNLHFQIIWDRADDNRDKECAFWASERSLDMEKRLSRMADKTVVSSTALYLDETMHKGKQAVYLARNATSVEDMFPLEPGELPEDMARIPEPRVGYVGVVYNRFDRQVFYRLAEKHPEISFVIVGGIMDDFLEEKYSNIYFLGAKPHEDLHRYYKNFDVCIIPYRDDVQMSMSCDPVKIHEQILCNVPTVTSFMPDTAMGTKLVWHADTASSYDKRIQALLKQRPSLPAEEICSYAAENSWEERAALLIRMAENRFLDYDQQNQVIGRIREALEKVKNSHPNYSVLYGISYKKEHPSLYADYVTKAYRKRKSPFQWQEYHLLQEEKGQPLLPEQFCIFEIPPSDYKDAWLEIQWFSTFWCNNDCKYCHMDHDRSLGHSFDIASPEEWAACFNAIKIPFRLSITGGETLLDHKNFTKFYNLVIDNPLLTEMRIDSNCTMPAKQLSNMNVKKTVLMTSYHPGELTLQKTIRQLKDYEKLGFQISMVNMVCRGNQIKQYKKVRPVLEKDGFTSAVGIYTGEDVQNGNDDLNAFCEVVDKMDIGFKTFFQPRGLPCGAAQHFLFLDCHGMINNCWGGVWNFFDRDARLFTENQSCPEHFCNCIEKYSMLPIAERTADQSLNEYIATYHDKKQTKIVLIAGYFGDENFGDELLLDALLLHLKQIPHLFPIVLSFGDPGRVAAEHNVLSLSLANERLIGQAACLCDAIILGPGGLLEDYARLDPVSFFKREGIYSYLYPLVLAKLNGKPSYGIGLGAGPFYKEETKKAVSMALSDMEYIAVRDEYSKKKLEECGLKQVKAFADLAFTYPFPHAKARKSDSGPARIGINLRIVPDIDMQKFINQFTPVIRMLLAANYEVRLIVVQESAEAPIAKAYAEYVKRDQIECSHLFSVIKVDGTRQTLQAIEDLDLCIAMRLHINIAAAEYGVPSVFLGYDEKVKQAALQLGMEDFVYPLESFSPENMMQSVKTLLKQRENYSKKLINRCRKLAAEAEKAWQKIEPLLLEKL